MKQSLLIIILALLTFPVVAHDNCYEVNIEVQKHKINEKKWDGSWSSKAKTSAPDLKLCIADSGGYRCFVDTSDYNNFKSLCPNSFSCNIGVIHIPDREFKVQLMELDTKFHDEVGNNICNRDQPCLVGLGTVTFRESDCHSKDNT